MERQMLTLFLGCGMRNVKMIFPARNYLTATARLAEAEGGSFIYHDRLY
jgi:hypothetical protein